MPSCLASSIIPARLTKGDTDGTYYYQDAHGAIEGDYTLEHDLIWIAHPYDEESGQEPEPEYFTILDRYALVQMHGEIFNSMAGAYKHSENEFYIFVSDFDAESLHYFFMDGDAFEFMSGDASENTDEEINTIWYYTADYPEHTYDISFYNGGHGLNVIAGEGSEWEEIGLTGYYVKAENWESDFNF